MTNEVNQYIFKGDEFVNRYRLEGELIAKTPLHIGTGSTRPDMDYIDENPESDEKEEHEIAEIGRDFEGTPYIPGSALKGVIRNYLLQIFRSINTQIAKDEDLGKPEYSSMKQDKKIDYMKNASLLEQLFGTSFTESKIEFWDAPAMNKVSAPHLVSRGWDDERQSYIVRSVVIDPLTGAAEPHKLYAFEVAPPGLKYQVNIVGQNLSDTELGFLIFGLNGFNSPVYPLTIGAMSGRGFGQMNFQLKNIYRVQSNELDAWAKLALDDNHAGYNALTIAKNQTDLIKEFKKAFNSKIARRT
ncbi:hypothetical protein JW964_25775 [candidate division KSB1 bacterium]|nr:hypothetical protein [candidate division KSB1 bacterium]